LGSIKVSKETVRKECTFQEWFDLYGTKSFCLGTKFGTREYDECVTDGFNGKVREVMTLKKVSISSILEFVSISLKKFDLGEGGNLGFVERQTKEVERQVNFYMGFVKTTSNRKKKKNKAKSNNKPKLVCEDLYDTNDYQHDVLSDEEEEDVDTVNTLHDTDGEWDEEDENVPPTTFSTSSDSSDSSNLEYHEQQLAELEELVKNDEFSIAFNDDDDDDEVSFHSQNSNSVPPLLTVVSKDEDDEDDDSVVSAELQDGWDLVSDVDSVKSIDSFLAKPSYKDILMQPQYIDLELVIVEYPNQLLPSHIHKTVESKNTKDGKPSSPTPSNENVVDEDNRMDQETPTLTIEDEREGVKAQRGGKPSKMFKREGKASRTTNEKNMQRIRSRNCKPACQFGLNDTRSNSYAPKYY